MSAAAFIHKISMCTWIHAHWPSAYSRIIVRRSLQPRQDWSCDVPYNSNEKNLFLSEWVTQLSLMVYQKKKKSINQCEHSNKHAGISSKGPPGYLLLLDHISLQVHSCDFSAIFPTPTPPSLFLRLEDHSWGSDPVGKEAVRCHDPHRFLPQCLCPHWPAALHGQSEAEVRALSNQQQCHQRHQQHCQRHYVYGRSPGTQCHSFTKHYRDSIQLDGVHQRWP